MFGADEGCKNDVVCIMYVMYIYAIFMYNYAVIHLLKFQQKNRTF